MTTTPSKYGTRRRRQETLTLKGHSSAASSVAFSLDGTRIVSGSVDNTLKVWDAEFVLLFLILYSPTPRVRPLVPTPDARALRSSIWPSGRSWARAIAPVCHTVAAAFEWLQTSWTESPRLAWRSPRALDSAVHGVRMIDSSWIRSFWLRCRLRRNW